MAELRWHMICVLTLQVLCVCPETMYLQLNPVSQKLKVSTTINTHYDVKEGENHRCTKHTELCASVQICCLQMIGSQTSDFLKQASFCVFKLRGYFKAQHEIHL